MPIDIDAICKEATSPYKQASDWFLNFPEDVQADLETLLLRLREKRKTGKVSPRKVREGLLSELAEYGGPELVPDERRIGEWINGNRH